MQAATQIWSPAPSATSKWYMRWMPSLTDLAFLMPAFFLFGRLSGTRILLGDGDTGWHIRTGEWILNHRTVPTEDLFSFTKPHQTWFAWEWGWDLLFAAIHKFWGLGGVAFVNVIVLGVVSVLLYKLVVRAAQNELIGFAVTVVAICGSSIHWLARPHLISWIFFLAFLHLIQDAQAGNMKRLLWLPALMLLWVNLHAGFVLGYAILGIALFVEGGRYLLHRPGAMAFPRLRAMAAVLAASIAVAIVNPNGWDIYLYPFQTGGSAEQQRLIVEWFSPNFQMSQIWAFEAMIFLIIGGLALARRIEARQFILLLVGLGLALHSVRNLSLFMLVAVPALADYAQQARERISLRRPRRAPKTTPVTFALNVVMILLVVAIVAVASLPSLLQRVDGKLVARDFPIKAANFLAQHPPPGHMLNVYGWGGYLIFRLDAPTTTQPVFIFGDAALAGDQLLRDYDHLQSLGTDQAQLFERYQINWVIFHSNDPIITELRQIHNSPGSTGWFELKTFDKATIMMRDTPANRAYAAAALE